MSGYRSVRTRHTPSLAMRSPLMLIQTGWRTAASSTDRPALTKKVNVKLAQQAEASDFAQRLRGGAQGGAVRPAQPDWPQDRGGRLTSARVSGVSGFTRRQGHRPQEASATGSWPPSWSKPPSCTRAWSPRSTPDWIEPLAGHLTKTNHFEPHWEKKRGQVVAFEQITLYGMIVVGAPAGALRAHRSGAVCA
jgi:ATP-dependent helicase HrpA